jgi:hypothetical protein
LEKNKTLDDYYLERIRESGYPLEIEISNLLDKRGYVVFSTQYYFDEETKQGRDIDIYAVPVKYHPKEEELAPFNVRTELAIECKKSETHAWFFYTRPRIPMSSIYIRGQYRTTVPQPEMYSAQSFHSLFEHKLLKLHYDNFERVAIAYDEIKKRKNESEKKGRKEIFEAVNQLVKFTCYEIHQTFNRIEKFRKGKTHSEHIIFFFPTIVFDGDLFEVNFDSGEPRLERRNHILLTTNYRCPYCQEVKSFSVDIVNPSHFEDFLKIVGKSFWGIREAILKNHTELVKKAAEPRYERLL